MTELNLTQSILPPPGTVATHTAATWLLLVPLLAPWLSPFASGPSPGVIPWLVSLASISIFALCALLIAPPVGRLTATSWLLAGTISSGIGLVQYFGLSAQFSSWVNITQAGEAFANLRQRNQFATLTNLALVAVLCFARVAATTSGRPLALASAVTLQRRLDVWWMVLAVLLLVAGNAASGSRTGLVQLLLVAAVALVYRWTSQAQVRNLMLVGAFGYIVAVLVMPRLAGLDLLSTGMMSRLHDSAPACQSRVTLWSNVLHLVAQKPWAGWGWRELDYAHFMTLYPGARFCDILDNAHNLPLHLAVELGLPVALGLSALGLWLVWRARPWRESMLERQMAWAVLCLIFLHSLLEYPLWYGPFQIAVALCVWLLWTSRKLVPTAAAPPLWRAANAAWPGPGAGTRAIAAVSASAALVATAFAGWDYWRVSQIYMAPEQRSAGYLDNTLQKIEGSWLFANQVRFARLSTIDLRPDNAQEIHDLALVVLHFSPEAKVAEKVIESAVMLGRDDEALVYLKRYRVAFPADHARWAAANKAVATVPGATPASGGSR